MGYTKHNPQRDEDIVLKQRIIARDQSAMKLIYDKHSRALFQFARNYLSDPNDAQDIVHETMMELWRNAERFEGRSSLKSWIYSIARNKSIDRNRKARRLQYTDEVPDREDSGLSPHDIAEASQDHSLVRDCVEKLPDAHRQIIHLVFFQSLSYQEISDLEGIPLGTVKTRVLHAKKKLGHLLAQSGRTQL